MSAGRILVVDDEPQIRRVMRTTLTANGYEVSDARSGEEAIEKLDNEKFDLVLLDVNMPGMTGLEACRIIRRGQSMPDVAIIMLTVRSSEQDKVKALDSGADDYVVKPFAIEELRARIRAALRRFRPEEPLPKIELPELSIDLDKRIVLVCGQRVHLTPKEFDVLRVLVNHEGKPITHTRLVRMV